jgi:hypothetical protein
MSYTIEGKVASWGLDRRRFLNVTLPYAEARTLLRAETFSSATGKGEQRSLLPSHVNYLGREFQAGNLTPDSISVSLRPKHRKALEVTGGTARIPLDQGETLPLVDGQHRLEMLAKELKEAQERKDGDAEAAILGTELPVVIHLDGNPKVDFLNLQKGRSVDSAQILVMEVRAKVAKGRNADWLVPALELAKILHEDKTSPFHRLIRFDSLSKSPLPVNSLCARGASDLATSLIGLVKVGGRENLDELAHAVIFPFATLREEAPNLLAVGKPLTPPPEGTKGSATMLLGIGTCVAYRLANSAEDDAVGLAVKAAKEVFDVSVNGNLSGPRKRYLMREFAEAFFSNWAGEKVEGVPEGLIKALSPSAFGVAK